MHNFCYDISCSYEFVYFDGKLVKKDFQGNLHIYTYIAIRLKKNYLTWGYMKSKAYMIQSLGSLILVI